VRLKALGNEHALREIQRDPGGTRCANSAFVRCPWFCLIAVSASCSSRAEEETAVFVPLRPAGAAPCSAIAMRGAQEVLADCLSEPGVIACLPSLSVTSDATTCVVHIPTGRKFVVFQSPFEAQPFRECTADEVRALPSASCPMCRPLDANAVGICEAIAGYKWTGSRCEALNCSCEGTDCQSLYDSQEKCEAASRRCISN
jgi:hypothetical protein